MLGAPLYAEPFKVYLRCLFLYSLFVSRKLYYSPSADKGAYLAVASWVMDFAALRGRHFYV